MFRDKIFLIETLGIGDRTREDTLLMLGLLYDEIKETGITEKILGEYLFIKGYIEKNRGIINNKDYSIITLSTFLQRANIILEQNGKEIIEAEKRIELEKNLEKISPVEIEIPDIQELIEPDNTYKTKTGKLEECTGIYGVYADDKLVYIGRTIAGFGQRFKQHKEAIDNSNSFLYQKLREYKKQGKKLTFKPLVILEYLKMIGKKTINVKELNCMEFALITALQPELNVEGRLKPYIFRNR